MAELREMVRELAFKEEEVVAIRKEIQGRIRKGETTGRLAVDYAVAAGLPAEAKLLREIDAFHAKLKACAGETAVVVLATRLRTAGDKPEAEVRMCKLPASPAFRFDETGNGWTLGESYASITTSDRSGCVQMARLAYSSTTGIAYPNPEQRLAVIGVHVGNAATGAYFRSGGAFGNLEYQALSELLGLPLPTVRFERTPTLQGVG